ncbi:hypothetical protein D3C78_853390 [compost metagenome]
MVGDNVLDDPVRQALAHARLDHVEDARLAVEAADQDGAGVATGAVLAQRGVAGAEEQPLAQTIDPEGDAGGEGRVVALHRVVLLLGVEGGAAVAGALEHQFVERLAVRPADHRALLHRLGALVEEGPRGVLAVGQQDLLPLLPQVHAAGPFEDGLELAPLPQRVLEQAGEHRVVVQDGADDDHVHAVIGGAEAQHGLFQPVLQLVALLGAAHVLVVLQVVADHQVGAVRAVAQAAHALAGAEHLHLGLVGGDDGTHLPDSALAGRLGEVHGQARVELQLGLDRLEHGRRLLEGVHDDQRVTLAPGGHAPDQEDLADQGRLGVTARRSDGLVLAVRAVHQRGQALVEVVVQQRVAALHVVREVGAREVLVVVPGALAARAAGCGVGVETVHRRLDLPAELARQLGDVGEEGLGVNLHGFPLLERVHGPD